jgi:hypothetical protein
LVEVVNLSTIGILLACEQKRGQDSAAHWGRYVIASVRSGFGAEGAVQVAPEYTGNAAVGSEENDRVRQGYEVWRYWCLREHCQYTTGERADCRTNLQ